MKKNNFIEIFFTMFKIGLFTFGGGYAMLPIINEEFVSKRKYISEKQMVDITALAESLPGAVAINICIIIGYKIKGVIGSICTTLGVVSPSLIIITIVTYLYNSVSTQSIIWQFIRGIRAGVVGIMLSVIIKLFRASVSDKLTYTLFFVGFIVAMFTDIHVIIIILCGGIIGYIGGKKQ